MRLLITRTKYALAVIGLCVSMASHALFPATVQAAGEAITGDETYTAQSTRPVAINNLQISGTGDDTVSVRLHAPGAYMEMSVTDGLDFVGDTTGGTLSFSGSRSAINTALATLTYVIEELGEHTIEVSLTDPGEIYYPGNGHLYEVISEDLDWDAAQVAAAAMTKYGSSGYLATMTSAEENEFVSSRLTSAGWMGANDSAVEGDWRWVTGPESGTSFYAGVGYDGGAAVGGNYANWSADEPNDSDDNEDCGQFLSGESGTWNDLPCSGVTIPAYVVEYGATGDLPTVATKLITVTVVQAVDEIHSCEDLAALDPSGDVFHTIVLMADIDCSGIESFTPLFDVEEGFMGTFNGNGHTISNLTISNEGSNYMALFSHARNATFQDVTISGTVTGASYVGALLGIGTDVTIDTVISSTSVTGGSSFVGGLVGRLEATQEGGGSHIIDSSVSADIAGAGDTGGLVGKVAGSDGSSVVIEQSYMTGNVMSASGNDVGGLVGEFEAFADGSDTTLTLQDVYNWGDVTAENSVNVGGLVGRLDPAFDGMTGSAQVSVLRSYSTGAVSGMENVGGIAGMNESIFEGNELILTNLFSTSSVTATIEGTAAAFIGRHYVSSGTATATNNLFDQDRAGTAVCSNENELAACTAVNIDGTQSNYFKGNTVNQPMAQWNFTSPWVSNVDMYPVFYEVPLEDDADGISIEEEAAAPNEGDGNNDGMPDNTQPYVSSFVNEITGQYVVLELDDSCSNTAVDTTTEASKAVADSGFDYPAGLLGFTSECGTPGYIATVVQYHYGVSAENQVVRKYNPTTNAYFNISGATIESVTVGGQQAVKVMYQIIDGSNLDLDGVANGTIIDPAGLAMAAVGVPNTGLGGSLR